MNKYIAVLGKIHFHPLFWVLAMIAVLTAQFRAFLLLFFIIFIHELGHAWVATYFSWRIKRIMLLPFGGVAEVEEYGRPMREELFVILAGPSQHILLLMSGFFLQQIHVMSNETWMMFFSFNVGILLVNLLPIYPLDGGKLLFLLLLRYYSFVRASYLLRVISLCFTLLMGGLLLVTAPLFINGWILVLFLLVSIWEQFRHRDYIHIRFLLERFYGEHTYKKIRPLYVSSTTYIEDVFQLFFHGCKHTIIINENTTIDENELLHAFFSEKKFHEQMKSFI